MINYDPHVAPDPEAWLALDEGERLLLIEKYHERAGIAVPRAAAHAAIHAIVETQIAMGDATPAKRVAGRLIKDGLDRHEAVHAIGSVLTEMIFDASTSREVTFPTAAYFAALERLTVESYLASAVPDDLGGEVVPEEADWLNASPAVDPFRYVGRNDPCPCGSGRKYKRCCCG